MIFEGRGFAYLVSQFNDVVYEQLLTWLTYWHKSSKFVLNLVSLHSFTTQISVSASLGCHAVPAAQFFFHNWIFGKNPTKLGKFAIRIALQNKKPGKLQEIAMVITPKLLNIGHFFSARCLVYSSQFT